MAQFVRPISDLDNTGAWTTTPLWSKIDDSVGSGDADFVTSDGNPTSSETFTVDGSTVTDPASSIDHILRVRASEETGGANHDIIVELRQGYVSEASLGTLIATLTASAIANTATTYTLTLSGAQADSITDYSDLQFRIYAQKNGGGAGNAVTCYDVELEVPDAGAATYDESVSITSNSTISPTNIATLLGDTTLNLASTIANANNNVMDASASFSADAQVSESGGLSFEASISLALQASLATSLQLEINGSVTILSNTTVSTVNNATVNNAIAIASSPGIFVNGVLDMDATMSLLASALIQSQGGSIFEDSIGISSNSTLSALIEAVLDSQINIASASQILNQANFDADSIVSIGSNVVLSPSNDISADENVSLSSLVSILQSAGSIFEDSVSITSLGNLIASGLVNFDAAISLSMLATIDPGSNQIANVSISISSNSNIGVAEDGVVQPPINIIINAKVPIGRSVEEIMLGSHYINEPSKGFFKNLENGGKYKNNENLKGKYKDD